MKRSLVFDVNETLLDLRGLDAPFNEIFGGADARQEWFQQLLQNMLVSIAIDEYQDFGALGRGALEMVASRRGRSLSDGEKQRLARAIAELPPHPDVRPALERLRDEGYRLATLTNSTKAVAEKQLAHAGLRPLFDEVFSADEARRLKPAPEPYRMVAERLGVGVDRIRLIAAHAWDVAGALHAGCAAAFVARPGKVLSASGRRPDVEGRDLVEVASRILEIEGSAAEEAAQSITG